MRFHDFPTACAANRKHLGMSEAEMLATAIVMHEQEPALAGQIDVELRWYKAGRPYYNIWPSIVEPLIRTKLDIPLKSFRLPMDHILFRFAEGHEPTSGKVRVRGALVASVEVTDRKEPGLGLFVDCGERQYADGMEFPVFCWEVAPMDTEGTVQEVLEQEKIFDRISKVGDPDEVKVMEMVTRIVVGTCLLLHDPEIVVPDVLAKDRDKFEKTSDPKFIEKAKRRGKFGWDVGRAIEFSPHFRRSHFAIRWTGPGATVPRLTQIKSSIVKREKLTSSPTGYLDEKRPVGEPTGLCDG